MTAEEGAHPTVQAVLVTYAPDLVRLGAVLEALATQGCGLILIDNASSDVGAIESMAREVFAGRRVEAVRNDENIGLAAAQNCGIALARHANATHVWLLDQDTILEPGTLGALLAELASLEAQGERVAAIGPSYRDLHAGTRARLWRARGWSIDKVDADEGTSARGDFIIASGALMPMRALDAVGDMEAGLFIDLIDIEWGLRAQRLGYRSRQHLGLTADHAIGEGRIRIGPVDAPLHAPARNYYWVRNALRLARRSGLPKAWRLYFGKGAVKYAVFYLLFANRIGDGRARERRKRILLGLRDGCAGPGDRSVNTRSRA